MRNPEEILKQYWGYSSFRPLQEEIINDVLQGNDTLALLPTGGGKSICFQVPAMCKEGICIVVSPLIALMKDQVYHLNQKGIKAVAVFSGMSKRLIDQTLDNCVYGEIKFLYVSPERLKTDIFIQRLKKMNINLWAIDEAHCISQWGYDFRPPYLQIAEVREIHPDIPVLALTATATPQVVEDIQEKLAFKEKHVRQKSFLRSNLSYSVLYEDAKYAKLVDILQKVKGSSVVYVRNRRKTKEIADYLNQCKISATFYHAGLTNEERSIKQEKWIKSQIRVMVSTNAFGMGIDKPDVRTVVHMDMPESPEAYFQEAGRAGRDELKAYAVLLFNLADKMNAIQQLENTMPSIFEIKNVYNALGNYFQLAIGSGLEKNHPFDIVAFCKRFNFKALKTYNALKFLEQEELLMVSEGVYQSSKFMIKVHKGALYKFMLTNKNTETLLKFLLRSYGGVFDGLTNINEAVIAQKINTSKQEVVKALTYLDKQGIIQYEQFSETAFIRYLEQRLASNSLNLNVKQIEFRIKVFKDKLNAMINYATNKSTCRSNYLLAYFGEERADRCGVCDFCVGRNKLDISELEYKNFIDLVRKELAEKPQTVEYLLKVIPHQSKDKLLHFLKWLIDYEVLIKQENDIYTWNEKALH